MTVAPRTFAPSWLTARPIAHRGLHDWKQRVVENSLGACRAAIEAGYAIECDLQISRDGDAVLFHDDTLDRVMEQTGAVKDFSVADLQRMTYRHSGERIPTLKELLGLAAGQVPLVIELKPQWDGDMALAERAMALLRDYEGPHCLMSFDPDVVSAVRARSPATVRGFISDGGFDPYYGRISAATRLELQTLSCLDRMEPHFLSVDADRLPWAPITELRRQGMPVICWTIRSPQQAALALQHTDQITFEGFRA